MPVAVVTGSDSGIGRAAAVRLAVDGFDAQDVAMLVRDDAGQLMQHARAGIGAHLDSDSMGHLVHLVFLQDIRPKTLGLEKQLGDKQTAHKWYAQAVEWMDKNQPANEELRRFRAEAAELLGVEPKKD